MKNKFHLPIILSLGAFLLVACEEKIQQSDAEQRTNTEQTTAISNSESNSEISAVSESSSDEETTIPAHSEGNDEQKPEEDLTSSVKAKSASSAQYIIREKKQLDDKMIQEAIEKIHEATDNKYHGEDFYFLPTQIDENTLQVDLYRQSPEGQDHQNLIAIYEFHKDTQKLFQQDPTSGTMEEVTPKK